MSDNAKQLAEELQAHVSSKHGKTGIVKLDLIDKIILELLGPEPVEKLSPEKKARLMALADEFCTSVCVFENATDFNAGYGPTRTLEGFECAEKLRDLIKDW